MSLVSFHVGRVGSRKADYQLCCKACNQVQIYKSVLRCNVTQIGYTFIMQDSSQRKNTTWKTSCSAYYLKWMNEWKSLPTRRIRRTLSQLAWHCHFAQTISALETAPRKFRSLPWERPHMPVSHSPTWLLELPSWQQTLLAISTVKTTTSTQSSAAFLEKYSRNGQAVRRRRNKSLDIHSILSGAFEQAPKDSCNGGSYDNSTTRYLYNSTSYTEHVDNSTSWLDWVDRSTSRQLAWPLTGLHRYNVFKSRGQMSPGKLEISRYPWGPLTFQRGDMFPLI